MSYPCKSCRGPVDFGLYCSSCNGSQAASTGDSARNEVRRTAPVELPAASVPESVVRRELVAWAYARGAVHVTDAEQGYRPDRCPHCREQLGKGNATTRIDRGFPDLVIFWPAPRGTWWVECKSAKGKQTEHQRQFEAWVRASGGVYLLLRSVAEAETEYAQRFAA